VLPAVALGVALRARGFDIVVLGDSTYESEALRAGLSKEEWANGSDVSLAFLMRTAAGQRWLWNERPRRGDRWLKEELNKHWGQKVESFLQNVGATSDTRIVAAVASISAWHFMHRFHPGCARIISCPMPFAPSKEFTLDAPDLSVRERLKSRMERLFEDRGVRRKFLHETYHLVSASPTIFPRPQDWASHMQVTGYTPPAPERGDWRPPAALAEFIERGSPPVYVGFGSYPFFFGPKGEKLARMFVKACESLGARVILHSEDLPPELASDSTFLLRGGAPHTWLFPRCGAIVHHGGYGTMHAALLAGKPMVIYPLQTDQFLWARRMGQLGAGPGFRGRLGDLEAKKVRQDLAWALERGRGEVAQRIGARLSREDGHGVQVAYIESIIEHQRLRRGPADWKPPLVAPA
jgi:UDP:flavonoid glycosyltransferase YjiC (YdhE family)